MMERKNVFTALGLMSGTSLDGLDLTCCRFEEKDKAWHFQILRAQTVAYPPALSARLAQAMSLCGLELMRLDKDFAVFMAETVRRFLASFEHPHIDFLASHGHTVFHAPAEGFSTQIGNGAVLAALTDITTVCDFRSVDVALNGQGAPLVPIGDELLFPQYDVCLNLGGFSNLSYSADGQRFAFDVSPCNMALNALSRQRGLAYDRDGGLARRGHVAADLLARLNALPFYAANAPKSLGKEWFDTAFWPLVDAAPLELESKLATVTRHIAQQIGATLDKLPGDNVLVTGGGAKNTFLMETLAARTHKKIVVPEAGIVDFKEALIFAFLGLLRLREENNVLCSVTGATRNSVGGAVYQSCSHGE